MVLHNGHLGCLGWFWLLGGLRGNGFFATSTVFGLPDVPFPLFEMGQTVDAEEGNGTVILVTVVRVELDADISIKVSYGCGRMKRL